MGGLTPSSRLSRMSFQVGRLIEHTITLVSKVLFIFRLLYLCAIIIINNHNQCPLYIYNILLNSSNYCSKSIDYCLVVAFELKALQ